ncbi:DUF2867 domain-containing protein [Maritalea sp.]|uniref:DUF2867 domain-containing protein n=1 Tax=Maritalea sp. TaxID=2003361 RepID=UPI003EF5B1B0
MANRSTLPEDSVMQSYARPQDYADSFAVDISGNTDLINCDIRELATQFCVIELGWAKALLSLRNKLVRPLKMKTADDHPSEAVNKPTLEKQVGDRIGFFKIYAIRDNEIILGEDDWHQDFRTSIYRKLGEKSEAIMSTVCQRHNLFGHFYLATILPIHILGVRTTLNDGATKPLVTNRYPAPSR